MITNQANAEVLVWMIVPISLALIIISVVMWKSKPKGKNDMRRQYSVLVLILAIFLLANIFALVPKILPQ